MSKESLCLRALLLSIATVISTSGCAKDYSMAPRPDGEKVTLTMKVSDELEPDPVSVMYRSAICQSVFRDGDERPETLDGHKGYEVRPLPRADSGLYKTELYINGGGPCDWRLSSVVFGINYRAPNRFGKDVASGTGGTVIVRFDENNPPLSVGRARDVTGSDLRIVADYYPWVNENFIGGYSKRASLSGEGRSYLTYKAHQARNIYFEPVLHSDLVVTSVSPKKQVIGDFIRFYYPDGTIVSNGQSMPDFVKMQNIRLSAEAKK